MPTLPFVVNFPLPDAQVFDCETGQGVPGFTFKAYDVTGRVTGVPGPDVGLTPLMQVCGGGWVYVCVGG